MKSSSLALFALPGVLVFGCAHSQGEQVRDARLAQIDQQNAAEVATVDERTQAQTDELDREHERTEAALARSGGSDAEATEQLADVDKDRAKYCADARAALEKLSLRIDAAKKKVAVLGSRAPSALRSELGTAETERGTLERNIESLPGTSAVDWDGKRNQIDHRLDALDERVDKIADAVDGAA